MIRELQPCKYIFFNRNLYIYIKKYSLVLFEKVKGFSCQNAKF